MPRVVRLPTPPRHGHHEDGRQTLWILFRGNQLPIGADLISFPDGVELEIYVGGALHRRLRFLRDAGARRHADLLRSRLGARGFADRRGAQRVTTWTKNP